MQEAYDKVCSRRSIILSLPALTAWSQSFSRAHALLNRWEADHVPLSTEMDGPSAIKEEQKMDLDAMS